MPRREVRARALGIRVDQLPDGRGRHGNHAKGQANGRWNDAPALVSSHGYALVRVGLDHPLAFGNGYAYLHELVWASSGRPTPEAGELLHHRDEDKLHNALGNLEVLPRADHGRLHASQRERDIDGRFA